MALVFFHLAESFGGAERVTENLLRDWPAPKPLLLTNNPGLFKAKVWRRFPGPGFFPNERIKLWRQVFSLALILGRYRVRTLVAFMHYPAFLAAWACSLLPAFRRPRLISVLQGPVLPALDYFFRERCPFLFKAVRFLCRRSDQLIVPSKGLRGELLRVFGAKGCEVIPLGLRWQEIPRSTSPTGAWPSGKRRLIWAGRLAPEKNPSILFEALRSLKGLPWFLVVLGDGPLRSELQALVQAWGLGTKVSFWGFQENVWPFLNEAEVFVHTCLFEGFGLALLEAMASGCAVLAQACPYGPAEILAKGAYGLLFQDAQDLRQRLKELLGRPELIPFWAQKAFERAQDYLWEDTLKAYLRIINFSQHVHD